MSVPYLDKNRQPMPRCIDYTTSASIGLLRTIRLHQPDYKIIDSEASKEWMNNPTLYTAVDLLGEATILKDFSSEQALSAARFILKNAPASYKFILELARGFLRQTNFIDFSQPSPSIEMYRKKIAALKKTIRLYPYNPIAWAELSLYYATLGQKDKEGSAMQVALQLGGSNRFILRSAARCFVHIEEQDKSIWILNKSGLCSVDPWIASAEIAICESLGVNSKNVSKAKNMVISDDFTNFSISELAVGLGTIEMRHGDTHRAKKLIKKALCDPTENALAQAQWMATQMRTNIASITNISQLEGLVPASYEAQAQRFFYDADFSKSLKASEHWCSFQQVSPHPLVHALFVASTFLEDDAKAVSLFVASTPAQQNSFLVTNNHAFSLISMGQMKEGVALVNNVDTDSLSEDDKLILQATKGFISLRSGDLEEGRKLYRKAIDGFSLRNNRINAALAAYFLAREEKRLGSELIEPTVIEAKNKIAKLKLPPLDFLAKKL